MRYLLLFCLTLSLAAAILLLSGGFLPTLETGGLRHAAIAGQLTEPAGARRIVTIDRRVSSIDLSLPGDCILRIGAKGQIVVPPGRTFRINVPFQTGLRQVFAGQGAVIFGPGSVSEIYPQWWGAKGDGRHDDAPALDKACLAAYQSGGGRVYVPAGTYLLGTLSADQDALNSYVVPRDNVHVVGAGKKASVLMVAPGENARYAGKNAPNVFGTRKTGLLNGFSLEDLAIDWNGSGNLLTGAMTPRNNASLITIHGGNAIRVERVEITGTPGNQCIFIKNESYATSPGSGAIVRDCTFRNNGSGLARNYNIDHSTVYLMVDNALIESNGFTAGQLVNGTCYELHGSYGEARNNRADHYANGFYIATDYAKITGITIKGEKFVNCIAAFSISAATFPVGDVVVEKCSFVQKTGLKLSSVTYFVNGNTIRYCNRLAIRDCSFTGNSYAFNRFLLVEKIADLEFSGNTVSAFNDPANGFGIIGAGLALDDGTQFHSVAITGNVFDDVALPVYFPSSLGCESFVVRGNSIKNRARMSSAAVVIEARSGRGEISGNTVESTYSGVARVGNGNRILNLQH